MNDPLSSANYGQNGTPWWLSTDWGGVGDALTNAAGLFGGGGGAPIPTGYEWQTYGGGYGPGGGNLNPYSDALYGNINNMFMEQGIAGGYNQWMNQLMPELTKMSAQAVQPYNQQMSEQARRMAQKSMEDLGSQFGAGINSGAFTGAAADSASNLFLQAGLAGEQQRLGLLGDWSARSMEGMNNQWGNMLGYMYGEGAAQRVAPTLTPTYAQPKKPGQWDWGGFGQGAMAGAGIGNSILPGWGALIGGGLGALGGAFGLI
jgi:uncharacterized membrane protein